MFLRISQRHSFFETWVFDHNLPGRSLNNYFFDDFLFYNHLFDDLHLLFDDYFFDDFFFNDDFLGDLY